MRMQLVGRLATRGEIFSCALNQPDLAMQLVGHWNGFPKVTGSIPTTCSEAFFNLPDVETQSNISSACSLVHEFSTTLTRQILVIYYNNLVIIHLVTALKFIEIIHG